MFKLKGSNQADKSVKIVDEWKIYEINMLGAWLVAMYKNNFSAEVNGDGTDGLIQGPRSPAGA